MEDGGRIEDEDTSVDKLDMEVEVDDSLDLADRTSIWSLIERLRLRGIVRGVGFVFMDVRAAAAALRFGVKEEEDVRFRVIESVEEDFVDRVCRIGGDRSGDILLLLFCFIGL